jgi:hypothetical protein
VREGDDRVRRQAAGTLVVAIGAGSMVAFAFFPWVVTGEAERNSFELVRAGRELGVLDEGIARVGGIAWFLVPLIAASTWLLLALRQWTWAAALGTITGAAGVVMGIAVRNAPVSTRPAVALTMFAGLATVGGAALLFQRIKENE